MAKNLYNLTAVTTAANTDLLHVNQGSVSSDRKITKANLLKEVNAKVTESASISAGSSQTFTCATNTRFLLVALGTAAARCGMWYGYCGGDSAAVLIPVVTAGSNVSVSTSSNTFTVTNSASSTYLVKAEVIVFNGSIT